MPHNVVMTRRMLLGVAAVLAAFVCAAPVGAAPPSGAIPVRSVQVGFGVIGLLRTTTSVLALGVDSNNDTLRWWAASTPRR